MSQLNVYVPEDLEKEIRKKAKERGESISKFLSRFFRREIVKKGGWQDDFFRSVVGRWQGRFPEIEREPSEERKGL